MNIKSLLIGSAAALATVSGAQAADAIVAAEPEPLEYVRVCDAFGTGFFYIPGSETCLKFGGYIRFEGRFGRDRQGTSDWDFNTRAQFDVDTRTDTELGALRGFIGFRGEATDGTNAGSSVHVDQAFISLGGFTVGKIYSEWDNDLNGETDILSTNALFNSVRYTYDAGNFTAYIAAEELEALGFADSDEQDNNVGVSGFVGGTIGAVTYSLVGSYDVDYEDGAVRGMLFADIGPGTLGLSGIWASGVNSYWAESEWTVGAEYAYKATDKLTITPAVQYLDSVSAKNGDGDIIDADWSSNNAWTAGLTVDYRIVEGLTTKITANYYDEDGEDEEVRGFVRVQRSF
jgi:hypothetical protein